MRKMKKTSGEEVMYHVMVSFAPPSREHVWGNSSPILDPGYWEGAGANDQRSSPKERDRLPAG